MDGPHMVAVGVESMVCYWRELLELLPPGSGSQWMARAGQAGAGNPLTSGSAAAVGAGSEDYFPTCRRVGTEDLSYAVNTASRFSAYAAWSVAQGYLTARGGTVWVCAVRR